MARAENWVETEFFRSALTRDSAVSPTSELLGWLRRKNEEIAAQVQEIPLTELRQWRIDPHTGDITHQSGRFFAIEGIRVETDWGKVPSWDQPIINQPEVGYLGILAKRIHGVVHFLMQAKIEPGNLNKVQLSPTLQATKSNYTQVHKGTRPRYLEYFNGERPGRVLLDQLQSEQGARFLRKRNRNIIVEVGAEEVLPLTDDFRWMTLGQIKDLMRHDNVVNMDTRSVISGIAFGSHSTELLKYLSALSAGDQVNTHLMNSFLNGELHVNDFSHILSWLTDLKCRYDLLVKRIPLRSVANWVNTGERIHHQQHRYFNVIGVRVSIRNREVVSWDQPMIKPAQEGILAFIVKRINGIHHFLVQAKLEPGNFDILELAPTVQCLTGNYRTGQNEYSVPFIGEILQAPPERIWYSVMQSEEGGRFFQEQNRNMIVEVGEEFPVQVPPNYCWMTLNQLHTFMLFNNYLNIASRSLIAAVSF